MEDLQGLLEKINREGVEKADAEAKRIVSAAEAQAAELVQKARAEADSLRQAAEKDAEAYAARSAETIKQSARDLILGVSDSLNGLFNRLLAENVDKALADEKTLLALVSEAIKGLAGSGEITVGAQLVAALKAQLASQGSFTVAADAAGQSGFTVKTDGGRVEHSFTGEVIAAELSKRLRPDLAALLK